MAIAGYRAVVKLSGDSTAMVAEATTLSGGNTIAQITNTARRILNPAVAVTLKDNGVTQAANTYTLNFLYGKASKTAGSFTGPVTIDASYLAMHSVAEGTSLSINCSREQLETSVFGTTDKSYLMGLKSAEGSIESLALLSTDLDPGAGEIIIEDLFDDDVAKLLEVTLDPDLPKYWRGWVRFHGLNTEATVEDLVKSTVNWRTTSIQGVGTTDNAGFGFGR